MKGKTTEAPLDDDAAPPDSGKAPQS